MRTRGNHARAGGIAAWVIVLVLWAAIFAPAARADSATPTATPTPVGPSGRAVSTATATATIPSCANENLAVDPVTSPTTLLAQTVTGCRTSPFGANPCVNITVSSAAGTFTGTSGGSCSGSGIAFTANVTLLAGQTNHLEVCETPCFCPVTICRQVDRTGAPLDIVQSVPAVTHRIEGKKIVFKDKASDANKRKLVVQSKDAGISAPASGDEPTAVEAQLRIVRPGPGGETATMTLPVAGWKGLGKPPGAKGYRYADPDQVSGPCTKVLLKPGKTLKALCLGAGIGFSLDEAQQNDLAVDLTMGNTHHCMEFGGILKDEGTSVAKVGLFKAADSAAPVSCPP